MFIVGALLLHYLTEQVFSAHPHVFFNTQRPPQRVQTPLQLNLTLPSSQRLIQTPRALVQRQIRHQPHCMMGRFSYRFSLQMEKYKDDQVLLIQILYFY